MDPADDGAAPRLVQCELGDEVRISTNFDESFGDPDASCNLLF
jgi:hypothetical protein